MYGGFQVSIHHAFPHRRGQELRDTQRQLSSTMTPNRGGFMWATRFSLLYLVLAHRLVDAGKFNSGLECPDETRIVSLQGDQQNLPPESEWTMEIFPETFGSDATSTHSLSRACMQRSSAGLDRTFRSTSTSGFLGSPSLLESDQKLDAQGSMSPPTDPRKNVELGSVPNKRPPSDFLLEERPAKSARSEETISQCEANGPITQNLTRQEFLDKRIGKKPVQADSGHEAMGNFDSTTRRKLKDFAPGVTSSIKDAPKTKQVNRSPYLSKKREVSKPPLLPKSDMQSEAQALLAVALSANEEDSDIAISPGELERLGFIQEFVDCDFVWFCEKSLTHFSAKHLRRKGKSSQKPPPPLPTRKFLKSYQPLVVADLEKIPGYLKCVKSLVLEYTMRLSDIYLCFLRTEPALEQSMLDWSVDLHAGPPNLGTDKTWFNCKGKLFNHKKLMESLQGFMLFHMFMIRTLVLSEENPVFMIEKLEADQISALEYLRGYFVIPSEIGKYSNAFDERIELMKSMIDDFNMKRVHELSWVILQDWIVHGNSDHRLFWCMMVENGILSPKIQKICFDGLHFTIRLGNNDPSRIVLLQPLLQ